MIRSAPGVLMHNGWDMLVRGPDEQAYSHKGRMSRRNRRVLVCITVHRQYDRVFVCTAEYPSVSGRVLKKGLMNPCEASSFITVSQGIKIDQGCCYYCRAVASIVVLC